MRRVYALGPFLDDPDEPEDAVRGWLLTMLDDDPSVDEDMVMEMGATALAALKAMVEQFGAEGFVVGPELGREAKRLGVAVSEHPPLVKRLRALAGLGLHSDELFGPETHPAMLEMILDAAQRFGAAAPWVWQGSDMTMTGRIYDGGKRPTNVLVSIRDDDGPCILVHRQTRSFARALGRRKKPAQDDAVLAMALLQEPAWLRALMRDGFDLDHVPSIFKIRRGQGEPVSAEDLWLLALIAGAAGDLEEGTAGADVEIDFEDGPSIRVVLELPEERADAASADAASAIGPAPIVDKKIPRNAPCPCGSGRKYKRCCLVPPQTTTTASSVRERLTDRLVEFARRVHPEHFDRVSAELLRGEPVRATLAIPMVLFEVPLENGQTIAAEFHGSERLSEEEQRLLAASMAAPLSIWETLRIEPGRGFEAVDRLTGERAFIHERAGSKALRARAGLLGRVAKIDDRFVLDGLFPMVLPPDRSDSVIAAVSRAIGGRRRRFEIRDIVEPRIARAMFDAWSDEVAQLDGESEERHAVELINTDTEPFAETVDRFVIPAGQQGSIFAALLELPNVRDTSDSDDPRALTFVRKRNAMHQDWLNTVIGVVSVGPKLVLETNSVARADRIRSLIEGKLGDRVQHESREVAPQRELEVPPRTQGPIALDAQMLGHWLKPPLEMMESARLIQWQHQVIDALDGLTPRAAAEQIKSRRKLHDLLRVMEYDSAEGALSGQITQLRADLGIDEEGRRARVKPQMRALGMGRKASQTLIEFALPLLLDAPDAELAEAILRAAELVWNRPEESVTTLAREAKKTLKLAGIGAGIETTELRGWIDLLLERRALQHEDQREFKIMNLDLRGGQLGVQVAARVR